MLPTSRPSSGALRLIAPSIEEEAAVIGAFAT